MHGRIARERDRTHPIRPRVRLGAHADNEVVEGLSDAVGQRCDAVRQRVVRARYHIRAKLNLRVLDAARRQGLPGAGVDQIAGNRRGAQIKRGHAHPRLES